MAVGKGCAIRGEGVTPLKPVPDEHLAIIILTRILAQYLWLVRSEWHEWRLARAVLSEGGGDTLNTGC